VGIAETLGMPWTWGEFSDDDGEVVRYKKAGPEAMEVINKYHEMLPGVKNLAKKAAVVAGSRGYIYTKYGRRIRFPDKRFLYKASGMLIQSTSADLNKVALKLYDQILPEFGGYVIPEHLTTRTALAYPLTLGSLGMGKNAGSNSRRVFMDECAAPA
jgi:hypothetical protein